MLSSLDCCKLLYRLLSPLVCSPPMLAGMAYKGSVFGYQEARNTMATNFYGTADVCETLKPLLPKGARVVNVCRWVPRC